jgi:hypothetical protein
MPDCENVFDSKAPDDVSVLVTGIGYNTLKKAFFILILFIIVHSDVFIDKVLSASSKDLVSGRQCTDKGMLVQGMIVSIGFILLHILIEADCI